MPKFILDGNEIEFKKGQTILEAGREHGMDIPHFCWHPSLSVSGNCRVCLVEVEKIPKLVIACATLAAEGMVVKTSSEKAIGARNAVMEFLLINHPLDCPICDEAGECKLQDYAYAHSAGESRFVEEKVHKDKRVPLGPYVMFDAERCISCSRCIRFCDEIAKDPELTFIKRGDRVTIVTYPGEELDNPYSLNVTDICPVGALTSRDFRFRARVWDMSATKSVCNGCARGCNMEIWVRNNEVLRLTPRFNGEVNSYWMCDYGRINTYKFINDQSRVDGPYIKQNGKLEKALWKDAYKTASAGLKKYSREETAFIASPYITNEDLFAFAKLAKMWGVKNIGYMNHIDPSFGDELLKRNDITPNSSGAELILKKLKTGNDLKDIIEKIKAGTIKAVYLIEDDLVSADASLQDLFSGLEFLVVNSTNLNKLTESADVVFPAAAYAEKNGTIINFQGRLQRLRPALAAVDMDRAMDGMSMSRLDKFGTSFDKWAEKNKRDVHSSWKLITELANAAGYKFTYSTAEDVFDELASAEPLFSGIDYDGISELGINLKLNVMQTA